MSQECGSWGQCAAIRRQISQGTIWTLGPKDLDGLGRRLRGQEAIGNGHTVDERLDTSSVKSFYDVVKGLILSLFQEQKSPAPEVPAHAAEPALARA